MLMNSSSLLFVFFCRLLTAQLKRSRVLRRLTLLTFVCLLAQCTSIPSVQQTPPAPQARDSTQTQTLTPQEQLDLFNTFLDRA